MSENRELHVQAEDITDGWEGLLLQLPAGWKLLGQELEGAWYAVMPDTAPVVVAWGEDPQELAWEIARKAQMLTSVSRCSCSIHSYATCQCPGA